jgi:tetratricopeptide (TPR) repeat protein
MNLFERFGDFLNLKNAISNRQKALELSSDGHPGNATHLLCLAHAQYALFAHFGDLSGLESAVSNMQKAVELTNDRDLMKGDCLSRLARYQHIRFRRLGNSDDLAACVSSYKAAAQLKAAPPSHALKAARLWAHISHRNGDLPSALDGYHKALELLPMVAWLGLDAADRQRMLLREKSENLACLAATCAIQLGYLEEAVELLDRGRSVFWDQLSSLRSDLELLRVEDAALAKSFEGLSQRLDAESFSSPEFFIDPFDGVEPHVGPGNPSDPFPENYLNDLDRNIRDIHELTINLEKFGRKQEIGRERRHLVYEWEGLLEKIQKLPRFKYFLHSIPFHQLRQACMAGQVVIINISIYGADALIFGTNGPIEHVPLSDVDLETITELSRNIVLSQPVNGSEKQRQRFTTRFLNPALRTIWNDVLTHIFKKIHISLEETTVVPRRRIPLGLSPLFQFTQQDLGIGYPISASG